MQIIAVCASNSSLVKVTSIHSSMKSGHRSLGECFTFPSNLAWASLCWHFRSNTLISKLAPPTNRPEIVILDTVFLQRNSIEWQSFEYFSWGRGKDFPSSHLKGLGVSHGRLCLVGANTFWAFLIVYREKEGKWQRVWIGTVRCFVFLCWNLQLILRHPKERCKAIIPTLANHSG